MNKIIIAVIVLIVLIGAVAFYPNTSKKENSVGNENSVSNENVPNTNAEQNVISAGNTDEGSKEYTIKITNSGYEPSTLEIAQGDKVTWVSEADELNWPASAMHPTHKIYPDSGIEKCGTSEETDIFDACKGLQKGENWSFTFNNKGEWAYHDHINVRMFGKIIVK